MSFTVRDPHPGADGVDLLLGAEAIAGFLNLESPRQAYRIYERRELPIFKLRGKLAARRSTLLAAIERLEGSG